MSERQSRMFDVAGCAHCGVVVFCLFEGGVVGGTRSTILVSPGLLLNLVSRSHMTEGKENLLAYHVRFSARCALPSLIMMAR